VQFNNPPALKPLGALVVALLLYGVFAGWHVWKTWQYPDLIVPGLLVIGSLAAFFVWIAGFVFPRLKRKTLPRRKWLHRGIFCGAFLMFVIMGTVFSVSWEAVVQGVIRKARVPEPTKEDYVDGRLPDSYWDKWDQAHRDWQSAVRSAKRPLDSAAWITSSLLFAAAIFFRPDPVPKQPRPQGPKPPSLPLAEGMKSRVVTDKWWEKYN